MSRSSKNTYTPAWWVPGAHLQTLWGKLARRPPRVATRVEQWTTPDDDRLEIRRLDAPASAGPKVPRLLILHGLEGTIRSHYILGLLEQARQRGWAADVLIFRGCNGELPRAPRFYHSGETSDLDFVIRRLLRDHPSQALVIAGVSLGGNVLLKWLGECGEGLPAQVRAAAAISVPFDLAQGSRLIERGFSRLYTIHFLRSLRRKALAKLAQSPGLFAEGPVRSARTLTEFDDAVTAPVHGFSSASDYYTRSSSLQFLKAIRCRTLLLSSYDDPFLPRHVLHDVVEVAQNNRCISVEFHERGGHAGFVMGRVPWRPAYHAEERVGAFFESEIAVGSELDIKVGCGEELVARSEP